MTIFDDIDDDDEEEEGIGNILYVNHFTKLMKMIMRYVVTIISTYLIFVNFGSPPHYLTFKKYAKKCVNFLQNIQNWAKGANIGQNFAFSLQKSTPA